MATGAAIVTAISAAESARQQRKQAKAASAGQAPTIDLAAKQAEEQKKRRGLAQGRGSTILTSPTGAGSTGQVQKKTLLGA